MNRPVLAIVGRPNVGKSTLFNRLVGERRAIVEHLPGTTRDRIEARVSWEGRDFTVVDSGGFEPRPESSVRQKVRDQVEMAILAADVVIFLVDTREGVTPADEEIADILRRSKKPVVLVANKVDTSIQRNDVFQFYELSMGDPVPVSGYHGKGIDELMEKAVSCLPPTAPGPAETEALKVAIVGRPNVGKSLLINNLLGQERLIVHDTPGTTRDTVDTVLRCDDETVVLIDTAGLRRRGRIEAGIERYSSLRTQSAIERSDVALLLADAVEGITAQDMHILGYVRQSYKGAILGLNKWDLVEVQDVALWTDVVRQRTRFMPYIEILFLSAKTGYGVDTVVPTAKKVYMERLKRPPNSELEMTLKEALAAHLPPRKGTRKLKVFNIEQAGVNPPTFVFSVNDASLVHFSYSRYLENRLRQSLGFQGTPIRLMFKGRGKKGKSHRED